MKKKHPIYLVAFSHLDLFWAGTREECLSRGNLIIRRAIDLLEKYPEFRFMIETTNFIAHFLHCFPEEKTRVTALAATGRLEFVPMRSGIYSHLPAGETTVRNILYGSQYCQKELDVQPRILSISDIPGAISQLPQLVEEAGMDAIVVSRGFPKGVRHFNWHGLDGTSVRAYAPLHYDTFVNIFHHRASSVDFDLALTEQEFEAQTGAIMSPEMMHYGTDLFAFNEKVLEQVRAWNQSGKLPLKFSTFEEFFAQPVENIPSLTGESPNQWPHFDSTWPDIWPFDLQCEEALHLAEYLKTLSILSGNNSSEDELKNSWIMLLDAMDHNQNGIGGETSDQDKLDLKICCRQLAMQAIKQLAWKLAARVQTPHQFAFPIIVFNQLSWTRSEMVTGRTALYGETVRGLLQSDEEFRLIDQTGTEVPFRTICRRKRQADTIEIEFYADKIPAFGCKVWYLEPGLRQKFLSESTVKWDKDIDLHESPQRNVGCDHFENRHFTLTVDRATGEIDVYDKIHEKLLFSKMAIIGVEERSGSYIENMTPSGRVFPALLKHVELLHDNADCLRIAISGKIYDCGFKQIITLPVNSHEIEIENTIDWQQNAGWVRIEQTFPFAETEKTEIRYGSPFGLEHFPRTIFSPDLPAAPCDVLRTVRLWTDISSDDYGVTIGSDHRQWEFDQHILRAYMVRGIGWCSGVVQIHDDQTLSSYGRPPTGKYIFKYRLRPHAGKCAPELRCGWELNFPLLCVASSDTSRISSNPGLELPVLPDSSDTSIVISYLKPAEYASDGIVLRCFESIGQTSSLKLPACTGKKWFETDLLESSNTMAPLGSEVEFTPFEIKTIILR